jgi:hypothetical protein
MSIVAVSILALWVACYVTWDPRTHLGAFFGNAIADWAGVVIMVIGTKYLYEKGSQFLRQHSFSIFLLITGAASSATSYPSGRKSSAWCC